MFTDPDDKVQISLWLAPKLLYMVEEAAKTYYLNRADYIRQALIKATEADEERIQNKGKGYLDIDDKDPEAKLAEFFRNRMNNDGSVDS